MRCGVAADREDAFVPLGSYTAPAARPHGVWSSALPTFFRASKASPQPGPPYRIDVYAHGTSAAGLGAGEDFFTLQR